MPLLIDVSMSEDFTDNNTELPNMESFQLWAEAAYLNNERSDVEAVASFRVVDVQEMQELNRTYRDKDRPTNVLSFPMQLPEEVEIALLGDLALCAPVIQEEAKQQNKSAESHWAHMVVHGMLHLQGFDHIETAEAENMEAHEVSILQSLGFEDPYL